MQLRLKHNTPHPKLKWIGLIHVKPKPENSDLGGASGAFVASTAFAVGPDDYGSAVTTALHELGFDVVKIEDVEALEGRMQRDGLTPAIRKLATMVDEHHPFALGTFHAYGD